LTRLLYGVIILYVAKQKDLYYENVN
jgi:hypothetical protein